MPHPIREARELRFRPISICLGLCALAVIASAPLHEARAEDPKTINKVTEMNKKALEAYAVSDFNKARQILKQALDLCNSSGLEKHAITARTHIHMGVVMVGGLNQRDLGLKQFQKALEIQPDIQVTRNVATPDVLAAFKEAAASVDAAGGATTPPQGGGSGDDGADAGGEGSPRSASTSGIIHTPVTKAKAGQAILITARLGSNVTGYEKVVLGFKAQGDDDFTTKDMTKAGNKFAAQIPAGAAHGRAVLYFIEAQDSEGTVLASVGGESKPLSVALGGGKKCPEPAEGEEPGDCEEGGGEGGEGGEGGPPLFFALLAGWGGGYTTGYADRTNTLKVTPGFAPSSIAHVAPEVGYFLKPDLRLSLQARIQIVGGPNAMTVNGVAKPAAGLGVAVFARASWFFDVAGVHPYATVALGGGQIRHVVLFSKADKTCGNNQSCIDSVTAGPVFVGGGGGLMYDLTRNLGLVADVNGLVGFTKFTLHLDLNAGVALRI
jgi:hypothetical protein